MLAVAIGMKILGSALVIGSGTGIGYLKGRGLDKKLKDVTELERLLVVLENEICYRRSNLIEAFDTMGKGTEHEEYKRMFSKLIRIMSDNRIGVLEGLEQIKGEIEIDKRVYEEIVKLFKSIGTSDIDGEMKNLKATQQQLEILKGEYMEYNKKYKKIYNASGGLLGTVVTLILL